MSHFSGSKSLDNCIDITLGQIILKCLNCVEFLDFVVAKFNGYRRYSKINWPCSTAGNSLPGGLWLIGVEIKSSVSSNFLQPF